MQVNEHLRKYLVSLGLRADASEEEALEFLNGLEGAQAQRADYIARGVIVPVEGETEADAERTDPEQPAETPAEEQADVEANAEGVLMLRP